MNTNRKFYTLMNFSNLNDLKSHNAFLTPPWILWKMFHPQDLSVYMRYHNLTAPVRKCGIKGFLNKKWNLECLTKLGLTLPCAEIWYYNSKNTRKKCLKPCLKDWNQPYNVPSESACPNCKLNSCLQCDETNRVQFLKRLLREPGEIVVCPVQYGGHRRVLQISLITTTEKYFLLALT